MRYPLCMIQIDIARFTLRRLLKECGVSRGHASEMANGKRRATLDTAAKLQDMGGPDMSSWASGGDPLVSTWNNMRHWEPIDVSEREASQ